MNVNIEYLSFTGGGGVFNKSGPYIPPCTWSTRSRRLLGRWRSNFTHVPRECIPWCYVWCRSKNHVLRPRYGPQKCISRSIFVLKYDAGMLQIDRVRALLRLVPRSRGMIFTSAPYITSRYAFPWTCVEFERQRPSSRRERVDQVQGGIYAPLLLKTTPPQ